MFFLGQFWFVFIHIFYEKLQTVQMTQESDHLCSWNHVYMTFVHIKSESWWDYLSHQQVKNWQKQQSRSLMDTRNLEVSDVRI